MVRVIIAMTVACAAAAVGQILVRRGMQQVGSLERWAPRELLAYFWRALTNPFVIAGTVGNALFYFIFLGVLSWAEVTVALPMTALEYAFAAVLSIAILKEVVPPLRWAGITLIILGVVLIGIERGKADRAHPTPNRSPHKDTIHESTPGRPGVP